MGYPQRRREEIARAIGHIGALSGRDQRQVGVIGQGRTQIVLEKTALFIDLINQIRPVGVDADQLPGLHLKGRNEGYEDQQLFHFDFKFTE